MAATINVSLLKETIASTPSGEGVPGAKNMDAMPLALISSGTWVPSGTWGFFLLTRVKYLIFPQETGMTPPCRKALTLAVTLAGSPGDRKRLQFENRLLLFQTAE
jgi:hypothetical protein